MHIPDFPFEPRKPTMRVHRPLYHHRNIPKALTKHLRIKFCHRSINTYRTRPIYTIHPQPPHPHHLYPSQKRLQIWNIPKFRYPYPRTFPSDPAIRRDNRVIPVDSGVQVLLKSPSLIESIRNAFSSAVSQKHVPILTTQKSLSSCLFKNRKTTNSLQT